MEKKQVKPSKVLVVDDNPKNIQVIANILTNEHYSVGYATNGQMAISTLKNANDYDLVLLDIDMPVMNGLEACRQIKEDQRLKNIPIIFLTAYTDTEKIVAGFEAGAQDYVTKPFNSTELLARVKTHIDLKKSREILLDVNLYLEEQVLLRTEELSIAYEKLDKANAKLEQLDQAKTEFIHILSHEIRTPLNGIIGSVSLLKLENDSEKNTMLLDILDRSVKRLEHFSYQTLNISSLRTHGAKALSLSKVNMADQLKKCITDLTDPASIKKISFKTDNQTRSNLVEADECFIQKLLHILLNNAIKHSPENTEVRIETEILDDKLLVWIRDSGPGFSDELKDSCFTPFSTGANHVNQNMGLDLYFARLVMDAHSGEIEVGNNANGGGFVRLEFYCI